MIFGYADRDVDGIEAEFSECRVVDQRTFALGDGIADHGKDSGVLIDAIEIVEISDFGPGQLSGGHFSFAREACVGEGGTCLAAEDAAERAEFAHAKANSGDFGGTDEFEHTDVVGWRIGHGNNFDNIRIALRESAVDVEKFNGSFVEVMVADDAFGFAIAANGSGGVFFEIDEFGAGDDGFAEDCEPLVLGAIPATAIGFAAAGDDDGSGAIFEQSADIGAVAHVVQSKFDQFGAFGSEGLMFFDHGRVASTSEADADHDSGGPGGACWERGGEKSEFRELAAAAAVRRSLVWKISFGLGPAGSLAVGALKFAVDFA